MDKLVERENATRNPLVAAPALAVQFFLIPLAVVGIAVLVFLGFRSLIADDRSVDTYLGEIRYGGWYRQWPAAYELSQLMLDPRVRADRRLAPELIKAFQEAKRRRSARGRVISRWPMASARSAAVTRRHRCAAAALNDSDGDARISAIWALDPGTTSCRRSPAASLRIERSRNQENGRYAPARCPATRRP
jgi:hypothetical protein